MNALNDVWLDTYILGTIITKADKTFGNELILKT